jgi:NADH-quinone oxidoreductase subunit L
MSSTTRSHVAHAKFSWVALGASFVVVFGGLGFGYLVYGKGLAKGKIDPMRKWLGPVWVLLHNKYYIDEIYQYTVIPV